MTELHELQIEEARELERKRLAQDLHDEFSASIAASINYLSIKLGQSSSAQDKQEVLAILDMLRDSYARMRKKSHIIFWEDRTKGFLKRIDDMVGILFSGTHIEVSLLSEIEGYELSIDTKAAILAILKESITNILRHASATGVEILFFIDVHTLTLEISDNGRGAAKTSKNATLGLLSMQRRMKDLGGNFEMRSNMPIGTIVVCKFPISSSGTFDNVP